MKTIKNKLFAVAALVALCAISPVMFGMQFDQEYLDRQLLSAIAAGNVQKTTTLLQAGASVNAQDDYNYYALHYTLWHNTFEILKLLVQRGAQINVLDDQEATPLHLAVNNNKFAETKYLVEYGADITLKTRDQETVFDMAHPNSDVLYYLTNVDNYNKHGEVALETLEKPWIVPDYLSLAIIKQDMCDIRTFFKKYKNHTTFNAQEYLNIARMRSKTFAVKELEVLMGLQPFVANIYKKLERNNFTGTLCFCDK